jgi:hypothetical protein
LAPFNWQSFPFDRTSTSAPDETVVLRWFFVPPQSDE